jgi:hypothetical protein
MIGQRARSERNRHLGAAPMPQIHRGYWLGTAVASLLAAGVGIAGDDSPQSFSPGAWQRTAQSTADNWSREPMIHQFDTTQALKGTPRAQILALLGPPGYASEQFGLGSGLQVRFDIYRLSAHADRSYVLNYDAHGRLVRGVIDGTVCACPLCSEAAPLSSQAHLRARLLKTGRAQAAQGLSVLEFEALLGGAGKHATTTDTAGGQRWTRYSDVWRISAEAPLFLLAEGARPTRDWNDAAFGEARVSSYTFVTLMPHCLAR